MSCMNVLDLTQSHYQRMNDNFIFELIVLYCQVPYSLFKVDRCKISENSSQQQCHFDIWGRLTIYPEDHNAYYM